MDIADDGRDAREFALHERLLVQHARSGMQPSIGVKGDGYFGGTAPVAGRSIRLGVRDGMDLLAHDIQILNDAEQNVVADPCLAITLMLDGTGRGTIADPISGSELAQPIDHVPKTLYASFSTRPLAGRSNAVAGSRYGLVELRLSHDLLKRLGAWPMLMSLDSTHTLHQASGRGFWVGATPAPASLLLLGQSLHANVLNGDANDLSVDARALDILTATLDLLTNRHGVVEDVLPYRTRRRIADAARRLAANPAHPWSIRELGLTVGLGDKMLKQGFRACFGKTVIGYLQDARLDLGKCLLETTSDSVTDISLKIGYANPSHFARLYRRRYGESPGTRHARKKTRRLETRR